VINIVKCVRDLKNKKLNDLVRNEVAILKLCQNRHIIKMMDFFELDSYLYIVLEYCNGGNLNDYVLEQKGGQLDEKESLQIL
jgi:serine/threonine protein kinase